MEHNLFLESIISQYKKVRYSKKAISNLQHLKSRCENLSHLLENYRYLQIAGMFSEENIEKIVILDALYEVLHHKERKIENLQQMINKYQQEIKYLEYKIEKYKKI